MSDIPQQQATGISEEQDGVTIGGSIPWFSVALTIHADDLDPNPPLMRRAADLGISLDFDIYNYADDEPSDAGPVI